MNKIFQNNKAEKVYFGLLSIFTLFFGFFNWGQRYDFTLMVLLVLIGILSLVGIFFQPSERKVTLHTTFCFFYYFFFSLAPIIQYKDKCSFYFLRILETKLYYHTTILLLVVLIFYEIGYFGLFQYFKKKAKLPLTIQQNKNQTPVWIYYILSFGAFFFYLYLIKFNWSLLVFRPFTFDLKNNTNLGLLGYAILWVVKFIPFVVLLKYKIRQDSVQKHAFGLLAILLVMSFPTSLSRGMAAILYLPIIVLFVPILYKKINYLKLYVFGVLLAFPLLENARDWYEGNFTFTYQMFHYGHFDAFQNFTLLLDEKIITHGRQFLGSIFFFVQESQWHNRPDGSGHLLGETVGYSYLNVAMPFFAEGYVNWGYLGILFFLIAIVLFNSKMDFLQTLQKKNSWLQVVFFYFLGYEFYLLRGDLYSSVKLLSSFLLSVLVVALFSLPIFNKKSKEIKTNL